MASSDPKPSSSSSTTSANAPAATTAATVPEKSYFETQRAALVGEIAVSLEHVLANINKLNRSLEGVIAVGNEFGSVEALWSQFENVMGRDANVGAVEGGGGGAAAAGVAAEKGSEKGGRGREHEHEHEDEDEDDE